MSLKDDEFFEDNIYKVNKLVSKVLMVLNILPPLLAVLSHFNIFQIQQNFLIELEAIIIPFTVIEIILVYAFRSIQFRIFHPKAYENLQHTAKYFGLIGAGAIISVMGSHAHIGIYMSYGLIIFLSCLFYSIRTTVVISIIQYGFMILSILQKSHNRFAEGMTVGTAFQDFVAFSTGFTIEFFFVFLVTYKMSKRNNITLHSAIDHSVKLEKTQLDFMKFIPVMLQKHELITGYHVEHTVEYVRMLCNQLKSQGLYTDELTQKNIELFSAAANMHDVGKIYIPDHILMKPAKFTPEEYEMMKKHPTVGYDIIQAMPQIFDGSFNKVASQMALCHHERWDGTGYPYGLHGEEIPLSARIMAVADVTDALLSYRPYKEPFSIEKAMQIIEEGKGTQFEPAIADAMLQLKPLIMMYANERNTKEKEHILKETRWREQERESLLQGKILEEELSH